MISKRMIELEHQNTASQHALWCLGAVFFAHAITFLSISYFDQIYVFFWGLLGGLTGFLTPSEAEQEQDLDAAGVPFIEPSTTHWPDRASHGSHPSGKLPGREFPDF
jgi:hypothetical protein